jgi:hypothetical protein
VQEWNRKKVIKVWSLESGVLSLESGVLSLESGAVVMLVRIRIVHYESIKKRGSEHTATEKTDCDRVERDNGKDFSVCLPGPTRSA